MSFKGLQVLDRDDYTRLHMDVEARREWKIGKYIYDTAPSSFYIWALKQPTKSTNLQRFIEWYHLRSELANSVDGGDID